MKLTEKAIAAIDNKTTRSKLALLLGKSEQTVRIYTKNNDPILTRADVLLFIEKETGLKQKSILSEDTVKA